MGVCGSKSPQNSAVEKRDAIVVPPNMHLLPLEKRAMAAKDLVLQISQQRIQFKYRDTGIQPNAQKIIRDIATALVALPEVSLCVEGHSNYVAQVAKKQMPQDKERMVQLSQKRAEAVKKALQDQGVQNDISCIGLGCQKQEAVGCVKIVVVPVMGTSKPVEVGSPVKHASKQDWLIHTREASRCKELDVINKPEPATRTATTGSMQTDVSPSPDMPDTLQPDDVKVPEDTINLHAGCDNPYDKNSPLRSSQLQVGIVVEVHGLLAAVAVNGCFGLVKGFDVESGRWDVQLETGCLVGQIKGLKPENLRPADASVLAVEKIAMQRDLKFNALDADIAEHCAEISPGGPASRLSRGYPFLYSTQGYRYVPPLMREHAPTFDASTSTSMTAAPQKEDCPKPEGSCCIIFKGRVKDAQSGRACS